MTLKVKPLASLAPGEAPDSNTLYTNAQGQLMTNATSGGASNIGITRAWNAAGLIATDTATLAGSAVSYTRTITVSTARNLSTWAAISAWTSSDGSEVPANLLSWNGDPLTLNGSYLTFTA